MSIPVSGDSVVLDTNVAIDVLADRAEPLTPQSITEFLLPVPVIGESWQGGEVERLIARCRVLDVTNVTAEV